MLGAFRRKGNAVFVAPAAQAAMAQDMDDRSEKSATRERMLIFLDWLIVPPGREACVTPRSTD
jgi:hypothetical protein